MEVVGCGKYSYDAITLVGAGAAWVLMMGSDGVGGEFWDGFRECGWLVLFMLRSWLLS